MPETLTEEDLAMLRDAQDRLRARACLDTTTAPQAMSVAVAGALPRMLRGAAVPGDVVGAVRAAGAVRGVAVPEDEKAPPARCQGGCETAVPLRGDWCATCATSGRRRARELDLRDARETFSPEGAADWCRAGNPRYAQAVEKALRAADPRWRPLIAEARWSRKTGSVLLLGPTDFGKTRVLQAIGHRILDAAIEMGSKRPPSETPRAEHEARVRDVLRFARGVRYISGLDIGEARSQTRWEEPALIHEAKRATLLLLDEVGWEDAKLDPNAVRNILRARFDPVWRPTIVASGKTWGEMVERYGEPTLRTLTNQGILVDLHPKAAA